MRTPSLIKKKLGIRIICLLIVVAMLIAMVPMCFTVSAEGTNEFKVTAFQTSSRYDLGIDAENVRLGWKIESSVRGYYQSAYHLVVTEASTGTIVFDTGWVESNVQSGISPDNLKPETIYNYKVNVKDQHGVESGWSEVKSFETAPNKIEGSWLLSTGLLRRSFVLDQPLSNVERARCYLGANAYVQIRCNGQKVGDLVMAPQRSIKDLFNYYNTYDITSMLVEGENVVGAYVTDWDIWSPAQCCGMIRIHYKDGSIQTISTNREWRNSSKSDVTFDDFFSGESIDARLRNGWDKPGFVLGEDWVEPRIAGPKIIDDALSVYDHMGTFLTHETFSGDYTVEAVVVAEKVGVSLQFGATDEQTKPPMWQVRAGLVKIHYPTTWKSEVINVPEIKLGEAVTLKIEVRGDKVTTYINGKKIHVATISANETNGALGIRTAPNESGYFDSVKVTQNGQVIWEDGFSSIDYDKWSYPIIPDVKPAVSGSKIIEEYKPVSITKFKSSYIVDFGQNMQGYVRLATKGNAGVSYTLEYSELLSDNGDIYANTTAHLPKSVYTLSGGDDVFEPFSFTTGFRYIKVTVSDGSNLNPDDWTACLVSDDLDQTGFFESSNDRLNMVYHMYLMSQRSCLLGIYQDCPQREKAGWAGDAAMVKEASALVLGDYTSAEAYLDLMLMSLNEDGLPRMTVGKRSTDADQGFDAGWASAYFEFPYQLYMQTGDTYYIEHSYETLFKIIDYVRRTYDTDGDGIVTVDKYGDWLGYDWYQKRLDLGFVKAVYFFYCCSLMQEMLKIIDVENAEFSAYLATMEKSIQETYFKSKYYSGKFQTPNALAIDLGLVTDENREDVLLSLIRACEQSGKTFRTGVLGTKALYGALSDANQHKLLLDMTISSKKCSFGYMIDNGATTLWEYWDKAGETFNSNTGDFVAYFDSQNHVMFGGGPAAWMLQGLGGIKQTGAAHKTITYRPGIESELQYVNATVETLFGTTASKWTYQDDVLTWDIEVPANTTATVIIPVTSAKTIKESGVNIFQKSTDDIHYEGTNENGEFVYTVGSGSYCFVVKTTYEEPVTSDISEETEFSGDDSRPNEDSRPVDTTDTTIAVESVTVDTETSNSTEGCSSTLSAGVVIAMIMATAIGVSKKKRGKDE